MNMLIKNLMYESHILCYCFNTASGVLRYKVNLRVLVTVPLVAIYNVMSTVKEVTAECHLLEINVSSTRTFTLHRFWQKCHSDV